MPRSKFRPPGLCVWLVGVAAAASPSPGQRGASSEAPMPLNGTRSWDMGVSRVLPLLLALPTFPPLLLLVLPFPPLLLPPKDHRPPLLLLLLPVV